ncbi:MAG: hypothetical protein A2Z59_09395 [Nitrospinae bacterium RIFCSPLOWO2_02_39_17]|nr:MAG: hypothetical protein A2Z59_09395 [Nitrospinae bacterium RIFCSPLOWO2_02_39_17]
MKKILDYPVFAVYIKLIIVFPILNYMLVAALEHFGENTQKSIKEIIWSGDTRVKALKKP